MDRHFQPALLGGERGNEPRQFPDFFVAGEREDEPGAADRLQFDDLGDFDLAYLPLHPAFPCIVRFLCTKDAGKPRSAQWIISLELNAWARRRREGGGLPLPLWERVKVYRQSVTPHPDRIFRCGPTSPTRRGGVSSGGKRR